MNKDSWGSNGSFASPGFQQRMESTELQLQAVELEALMQDSRFGLENAAYLPPKYDGKERRCVYGLSASRMRFLTHHLQYQPHFISTTPGKQTISAVTSPLFNHVQVFSVFSAWKRVSKLYFLMSVCEAEQY